MSGYTASERERIEAGTGWQPQRFCCITGRTDEPIEMHHVLRRSDGGEYGPQLPLAKTTHAYAKGDNYKLMPSGDAKWAFMPTSDDFAAHVAAHRKAAGLPHRIRVGSWYACIRADEGADELATLANEVRALDEQESGAWRDKAERIARASVIAPTPAAFAEWRADAGVSKGEASKMLTVCAYLERDELRGRFPSVQYEAARAIRRERGDRSEIVSDADVLSVTDFRARWWPPKDAPGKERCPTCGLLVDPHRLNEEE